MNKSHIHEVPQNNWLILHMGEVSHGQGINRDMILFVVLTHYTDKTKKHIVSMHTLDNRTIVAKKKTVWFTIVKQHNSCILCLQALMSNLFCYSNFLTVKQKNPLSQ